MLVKARVCEKYMKHSNINIYTSADYLKSGGGVGLPDCGFDTKLPVLGVFPI